MDFVKEFLTSSGPKIPLSDACDRDRDVCHDHNALCQNGRCECKDGYREGDGEERRTCGNFPQNKTIYECNL